MIVETALQKKGTDVAVLNPGATVADAAALLLLRHVGIVLVCDVEHRVRGVITDSDILGSVADCNGERCIGSSRIDSLMTRDVVTCKLHDEIREVLKTMRVHGLRRCPVVDENGKLLGIINLRDIFRLLRQEKRLEAHELEHFIAPPVISSADMKQVLDTLHEEHRSIGTVLEWLRQLVAALDTSVRDPPIELINTILNYMEAFPDTIHHPKEEKYLFEALRRRKPDEAKLLDQMVDEHQTGETLLTELRSVLRAYREDPSKLDRLQLATEAYVKFEGAHMRQEENVFMPLAARFLKTEDWQYISKAFALGDDPLFGEQRKAEFDALYEYMSAHIPRASKLTPVG